MWQGCYCTTDGEDPWHRDQHCYELGKEWGRGSERRKRAKEHIMCIACVGGCVRVYVHACVHASTCLHVCVWERESERESVSLLLISASRRERERKRERERERRVRVPVTWIRGSVAQTTWHCRKLRRKERIEREKRGRTDARDFLLSHCGGRGEDDHKRCTQTKKRGKKRRMRKKGGDEYKV